jgi:hypothetical protein
MCSLSVFSGIAFESLAFSHELAFFTFIFKLDDTTAFTGVSSALLDETTLLICGLAV